MTSSSRFFSIHLDRLPGLPDEPGLILLTVETGGTDGPTRLGSLTDAGLRGRLAHHNLHSANEIASVRRALAGDEGSVVVEESWSSLESCPQFWHSFFGSQIRPVEWTCNACGVAHREEVGGSVGETFRLRCRCGRLNQLTIAKPAWGKAGPEARALPGR